MAISSEQAMFEGIHFYSTVIQGGFWRRYPGGTASDEPRLHFVAKTLQGERLLQEALQDQGALPITGVYGLGFALPVGEITFDGNTWIPAWRAYTWEANAVEATLQNLDGWIHSHW